MSIKGQTSKNILPYLLIMITKAYIIIRTQRLALASYDINIRNIHKNDISKIIDLQKDSFSDMAAYGMIWPYSYIESHIHVFPEVLC
jgi:hypothetical protein